MENNDLPIGPPDRENLQMENELLRLKLAAEFGADSHSTEKSDPMLENEFLKHVMAFEHGYASAKRTKIFDLLGKPDFKQPDELTDELIDVALEEVINLLAQKNIAIDFSGAYDNRIKYRFITEELFDQETDDFQIPGMITHFNYEEFHPDHKLDIENRAVEFLSAWFEQKLDERSWCLDSTFVLPDKQLLSKHDLVKRLRRIFDSYTSFTDYKYNITDINFELDNDGGMGYAEGVVKYHAILENKEEIVIEGPFKLYLSLEHQWWSIFHIVFPGFEY